MWMPDTHPSENSANYAFDALGLCSDMQYNELFDLVVNSSGNDRDERKVVYEKIDGQKETILCSPTGLNSANSCGSSAGPGDQHARSREGSWPIGPPPPGPPASLATPPIFPVWAITGAPTKMHIPSYKGQGLSEAIADLSDLKAPRHRDSATIPSTSLPSFSPAKVSGVVSTAQKISTSNSALQTNIGNSSIPVDNIHRTLRHRKSIRDLHAARRAQLTELVKSSKMNQHHLTSSTPAFDEMLYPPVQNSLQPMEEISSEVPRYSPSHPSPRPSGTRSEYLRSPFSLSAENLHSQYDQVVLARPHSMSSLNNTPVISDSVGLQFILRRASDPTDSTVFYENQTRQFSLEDYASWMATSNIGQQSFDSSIDLRMPTESSMAESDTSQTWWDESRVNMEDDWTKQLSGVSPGQINDVSAAAIRSHNNGSSRQSSYSSMMFLHQPPSPSFDEGDSGIFPHSIKRSSSSCSVPSPPESPELYHSSQMPTPEVGFPITPSLVQAGFGGVYSQSSSTGTMTRQSSLPHTLPSPPSHASVIAAAAAALSATSKTSSKSITKSSSRPGSSRRKASSGSMRSQAKTSIASSLSSQSNDSEMSFVNFTPNDATRILSGVAPSGSSKTKARREREALEKRRKLSEAATAAVMAAGGDASALAQVDLL